MSTNKKVNKSLMKIKKHMKKISKLRGIEFTDAQIYNDEHQDSIHVYNRVSGDFARARKLK